MKSLVMPSNHLTNIGEAKRTLKVRLSEHKQVVKRGDPKNGIAVHAHESNHMIDWDGARVKRSGMTGYWQRRTTEAIHIKKSEETMNLDGGLSKVGPSRSVPPHPSLLSMSYLCCSNEPLPNYSYHLCAKPAKLCYMVEASLSVAAGRRRQNVIKRHCQGPHE